MFSNLSYLMNLTPSHLIRIIPPENIVNSKYYDIIQVETFKEFTDKTFLSLCHLNTSLKITLMILNTLFSQQRLILVSLLLLNQLI